MRILENPKEFLENFIEFLESLTDEEFEEFLNEYGFKYTKKEKGQGGLLYKGKVYKTYKEYLEEYNKDNIQSTI